jgi:DNA-binding GntR family transcriptional regulator
MIDHLELFPGTKITETEIANMLSVSRTPIREAFQRLHLEGQLDIIPRQGCFVRQIDMELINKFYDARIILESRAIELACDAMPVDLLKTMMDEWSPDKLHDDYKIHIQTIRDQEENFHINVAKGSGNEVLGRYLEDVNHNIRVVRWLGFPNIEAISDTYEEHYELCQIIQAGNKRSAKSAMKKHIQKSQKLSKKVTLQQLAEKRSEYINQHIVELTTDST